MGTEPAGQAPKMTDEEFAKFTKEGVTKETKYLSRRMSYDSGKSKFGANVAFKIGAFIARVFTGWTTNEKIIKKFFLKTRMVRQYIHDHPSEVTDEQKELVKVQLEALDKILAKGKEKYDFSEGQVDALKSEVDSFRKELDPQPTPATANTPQQQQPASQGAPQSGPVVPVQEPAPENVPDSPVEKPQVQASGKLEPEPTKGKLVLATNRLNVGINRASEEPAARVAKHEMEKMRPHLERMEQTPAKGQEVVRVPSPVRESLAKGMQTVAREVAQHLKQYPEVRAVLASTPFVYEGIPEGVTCMKALNDVASTDFNNPFIPEDELPKFFQDQLAIADSALKQAGIHFVNNEGHELLDMINDEIMVQTDNGEEIKLYQEPTAVSHADREKALDLKDQLQEEIVKIFTMAKKYGLTEADIKNIGGQAIAGVDNWTFLEDLKNIDFANYEFGFADKATEEKWRDDGALYTLDSAAILIQQGFKQAIKRVADGAAGRREEVKKNALPELLANDLMTSAEKDMLAEINKFNAKYNQLEALLRAKYKLKEAANEGEVPQASVEPPVAVTTPVTEEIRLQQEIGKAMEKLGKDAQESGKFKKGD